MDKILEVGEELSLADCLLLENGNSEERTFEEDLTEEEKLQLGIEMAEKIGEIDNIKSLQKRVPGLQHEPSRLSNDLHSGTKDVSEQCTWYLDKEQNTAYLRRDGTNEIVQIRSLTAEERQEELELSLAGGDAEDEELGEEQEFDEDGSELRILKGPF